MSWPVLRQRRRDGSWYRVGIAHVGPPGCYLDRPPAVAVKVNGTEAYAWKYAPVEDEL